MHLAMWFGLYLAKPSLSEIFDSIDEENNNHELFSVWWFYNLIVTVVIADILCQSWVNVPYARFSFTFQSFCVLMLRSCIGVFIPIFPFLHVINECTRFLCLSSAIFTSITATFFLIPIRYLIYKTPYERKAWIKVNMHYHLISMHQLNSVYAILNTMVYQKKPFTDVHLWFGFWGFFAYSTFYLYVMDRMGFHLYPFLSPRRLQMLLTWSGSCFSIYATYIMTNKFME